MISYITKRPLIGWIAMAFFIPVLGAGYYFQQHHELFLMRVFVVLAGIGLVALAFTGLFFADHFGKPIKVECNHQALSIGYLNKNGGIIQSREVQFSSLKGYTLHPFNLYADRLVFYYTNGTKASFLLATKSQVKGFTLETAKLILEIGKNIKEYNSLHSPGHCIVRYPSFMASNAGLASIIILFCMIVVSIAVSVKNNTAIAITTIVALLSIVNLLLYRYRERSEIRATNNCA
ncbi:hypothetical protein [Niabella drilacis]|uniref:Uncharacterized protein n=1 Tax=Niabella drilacis (strain DSM 25811 / CCM 8410 / CCUG 62505 / LMG 26954 / E90) TaxID=1285928 RepID=A0A1G6U1K8_NIADE|nr:hypothetical protein [Niabella drilacis]SDD35282.1 hypothetical protein SAMN04487894_108115 [Niabella drilacis]